MASGKSNCRSKYCPALIAMLRTVGRMRNKDICALLDMKPSAVYNIINRHGLADSKYLRKSMISDIEREYLAGFSSYELAEKYGVHSGTIRKWMHDLGHVKGKDQSTEFAKQCELAINTKRKKAAKVSSEARRERAIEKLKDKLIADGGEVSLVEYSNYRSIYKCNTCGCVFSRARERRGYKICCPECSAKKMQSIRANNGGKVFEPGGHRARCKRYGRIFDPSVTREKLIERDNNTCQICGGVCDSNDKRWGHFGPLTPSIDHVIALKNGGNHVWSNVQLAHAICNIIKNDNDLTEEVITHAKEQAIAYKCA